MRKSILVASIIILILAVAFRLFIWKIQPQLSTNINSNIVLFVGLLIGASAFIANFKDVVEFVQSFYKDEKSPNSNDISSSDLVVEPSSESYDKWDIFISYASEDGDAVATPLALALRDRGLKVWYDKFELNVGDSLFDAISDGLLNSRYGIVILSPAFFHRQKKWTKRELRGLFSRTGGDGKEQVLPVWYQMGADDVTQYSPILSDIVALQWEDGKDSVVNGILSAIDSRSVDDDVLNDLQINASIRNCLSKENFPELIQEVIDEHTSEKICPLILNIASTPETAYGIKLRAFETFVDMCEIDNRAVNLLLANSEPQLLMAIIRYLNETNASGIFDIEPSLMEKLVLHRDSDLAAAATKFATLQIAEGKLPLSFSTLVSRHKYYLVRRIAINHLTQYQPSESLTLLYEFRNTSYHISQTKIRDFISTHFEADNLDYKQIRMSIEILEGLSQAPNVSAKGDEKNIKLKEVLTEYLEQADE